MPTRYKIITDKGGALSGALNEAKGADIASATTCDIGAATGNAVDVTGTTTITGLGTVQAGTRREVRFTGALILTHHATSLILPTGANITTVAGDTATFISLGSGNWVCTNYQRKDGSALAAAGGSPTTLRGYRATNFTTTADTLTDVTDLSIDLLANKKYMFFVRIQVGSDANNAIAYLLLSGAVTLSYSVSTTAAGISLQPTYGLQIGPSGVATNAYHSASGFIDVGGTGRTLNIKTRDASGGLTTVYAGSFIIALEVA